MFALPYPILEATSPTDDGCEPNPGVAARHRAEGDKPWRTDPATGLRRLAPPGAKSQRGASRGRRATTRPGGISATARAEALAGRAGQGAGLAAPAWRRPSRIFRGPGEAVNTGSPVSPLDMGLERVEAAPGGLCSDHLIPEAGAIIGWKAERRIREAHKLACRPLYDEHWSTQAIPPHLSVSKGRNVALGY